MHYTSTTGGDRLLLFNGDGSASQTNYILDPNNITQIQSFDLGGLEWATESVNGNSVIVSQRRNDSGGGPNSGLSVVRLIKGAGADWVIGQQLELIDGAATTGKLATVPQLGRYYVLSPSTNQVFIVEEEGFVSDGQKLADKFKPILILGEGDLCPLKSEKTNDKPKLNKKRHLGFGTKDPYSPTRVETMLASNGTTLVERVSTALPLDVPLLGGLAPKAQDLWDMEPQQFNKEDRVYIDINGFEFVGDQSIDLEPGDKVGQCLAYEQRYFKTSQRDSVSYDFIDKTAVGGGSLFMTYWFFYFYNDFNNQHEGDWERITLEFQSGDCIFDSLASLVNASCDPVKAVYSVHNTPGKEHDWATLDPQVGTRRISYVGRGSHANFDTPGKKRTPRAAFATDYAPYDPLGTFEPGSDDPALGENEGRRFDDYSVELLPCGSPIPRSSEFAWIDYEGRWGQDSAVFLKQGPVVNVCQTP